MIEIIRNTKIDFMGRKNIALAVSGVLILLGIFTIVQVARGTANLGIDFAGGTAVQVKFDKEEPLQDIREALNKGGIQGVELQELPSENKVLIQIKKEEEENLGDIADSIITSLKKEIPNNSFIVDSTTQIGPTVGKQLRRDALFAILVAVTAILIYIAWRFQLSFGVGATVATFHDVMAVLGILYLLGREINLIIVSALLMIAGYSLTDTVVVFDRIRENLRKYGQKEGTVNVINRSINEVLSRTIITSLTTFFAAAALYLVGGEVIHDFALAIMLGIMVGTYSSIFVASPIVVIWSGKKPIYKKI
jgi:preprotein translocase subunit SecF